MTEAEYRARAEIPCPACGRPTRGNLADDEGRTLCGDCFTTYLICSTGSSSIEERLLECSIAHNEYRANTVAAAMRKAHSEMGQ